MDAKARDTTAGNGTFYEDESPSERGSKRFSAQAANQQRSTVQSNTGPVGEPGLPPSRPVSTATLASSQAGWVSAADPRRAQTPNQGGARDSSGSHVSRPQTSASTKSRTHVPGLTSAAFFRPMSSKQMREQANRPKPATAQEPVPRKSMESQGAKSHRHRNSNASVVTVEGQRPLVDADAPPIPTSRDTHQAPEFQADDIGGRSLRSEASQVPLNGHYRPKSPPVDQRRPGTGLSPVVPKSPKSFRESWGIHRNSSRANGHVTLQSGPPSPKVWPGEQKVSQIPTAINGKNYEFYNGNAVFFFHGRLLNSRQKPLNVVTGFLTVLPAALFFGFSAPWLWHHVSPAIPILFAYLFFICISAYLHASFSDPGIIPRNLHPHPPNPQDQDPLVLGPATTDWVTVRSFGPTATGNTSTAMEVPTKYCKSCNIWRPPRAHHCRICDACMETQDHHCVWLNNCVGRRNYRYFFTFVASGSLLALFLLAASLAHILVWRTRHHTSFGHAINHWRGPFAMVIYAILVLPYPASLFYYHVFLMSRGESTREYLNSHKFLKKDRHRPFSQHNIFKNMVTILCRARTPTYMRFKAPHFEGDQSLPDHKKEKTRDVEHGMQNPKEGGLEMKEMKGDVGFQGPAGRGQMNNTSRSGTA